MKQKVTFLTAILMVATLLAPSARASYDFSAVAPSGQTLYYNIVDGAATVTYPGDDVLEEWFGYTEPTGNLTIPSSVTYNGTSYAVTSIGESCFDGCIGLTSVIIPNTVTSIGFACFYYCTGLTSVTIPNSVSSIDEECFFHCISLASVTIPNSVTSIGDACFEDCSSLTSVTIPNSVTSIGSCTFYHCSSLTSVTIPNSVTSIGDACFEDCSSLTSVTIPNSVTSIGSWCFSDCTSLTSVTIPNSVTSIGGGCFSGCTSLTSVTIPNSVTSIGDYFFSGCSSLTSVTIGSSVTSIGNACFYNTPSLDTIYILPTVPPAITAYTFSSVPTNIAVVVPCGATEDYEEADYWDSFTNISEDPMCSIPHITVVANDTTMGTVSGSGEYPEGTIATLSAMPKYNHGFVGWADGNTDNPRQVTVSGDTTYTANFSPISSGTVHDTVVNTVHDTTVVTDTVTLTQYDTVTNTVYDTVDNYIHDTVTVTDTLWLTEYIHDTVYIHDTIVVGVDDVETVNAKIYTHHGQIVVEGAEGNGVWLYDVNGRMIQAIKQSGNQAITFDIPASGTYLIKIGNHAARKVVVIR